tara:strand:+ start:42 stop:371 length:330 start_codon:yes stop_codon:yes gene_type:complete
MESMKQLNAHSDCKKGLVFSSEWEDHSYSNDETAHVVHKPTMLNLWFDVEKKEDRYSSEYPRFVLYEGLNKQSTYEEWIEKTDMETDWENPLLETENFQDVLDYIESIK